LVTAAEGTASNTPGVAAVRTVQDRVGEKREDNPGVNNDGRKKLAAGQSIKVGCKFAFSLQTKVMEPGVLLVRVCGKEDVDANGQPAHPNLHVPKSEELHETEDWVYERLLSGLSPPGTTITGMVFSYVVVAALLEMLRP
jgi:hypothetical protein